MRAKANKDMVIKAFVESNKKEAVVIVEPNKYSIKICKQKGLPTTPSDYLELVDWSGRIMREDKKGQIPKHLPGILQRLELDSRHWLYLTQHFEHPFRQLVGAAHHARSACEALGQRWVQGISQCERLLFSA